MTRVAYVNGRYVPHAQACVHVEDRGYQFGDGVYEVCEIYRGMLVDETRHLDRLDRSLSELRIAPPVGRAALKVVLREVVRRNRVHDGLIYLQVTRGVARRDHAFPAVPPRPALVVTAKPLDRDAGNRAAALGIDVITLPDNRWERVDIKTVGLLPNCLARQAAKEKGAREAWLVDADGFVTEGAATNAWILTQEGVLVTRPAARGILRGVTRSTLMECASRMGLAVEERAFSVPEALRAREAFISAATTLVMPVIRIDGQPVGQGAPGPVALGLRARIHEVAELAP
jgi:D-alanine transaminase